MKNEYKKQEVRKNTGYDVPEGVEAEAATQMPDTAVDAGNFNEQLKVELNKLNDKPLNKSYAYTNKKLNPWYYEMKELGYHYRITDIQCALGLGQIKKLNYFLKKRKKIAETYDKEFKKIENISSFQNLNRDISSNHLYITKINYKKIHKTRADLMRYLEKHLLQEINIIYIYSGVKILYKTIFTNVIQIYTFLCF